MPRKKFFEIKIHCNADFYKDDQGEIDAKDFEDYVDGIMQKYYTMIKNDLNSGGVLKLNSSLSNFEVFGHTNDKH